MIAAEILNSLDGFSLGRGLMAFLLHLARYLIMRSDQADVRSGQVDVQSDQGDMRSGLAAERERTDASRVPTAVSSRLSVLGGDGGVD